MNIEQVLDKTFDAISLLLAFSSILFGIRYPEAIKVLDFILDPYKPIEFKTKRQEIRRTLWLKWLPVVGLSFIPTYSMSPIVVAIIRQSNLSLFHFETVRTAFFLTWIVSLLFFFSSLVFAIKMGLKGYKNI
ncbi:hypothetical protein PALU110988_21545 [Paenibacillus lupini]|nr:hypothetical protein [Paenibacillus lupini]